MALKSYTLPPDTRQVGDPDPANDLNAIVDAVTGLGAGLSVLNKAYAGGADPAGNADSTAAFQAAAAAIPAGGGVLAIPAGTYKLTGTVDVPWNCLLQGAGWGSQLMFSGTGDCIRIQNPTTGSGNYATMQSLSGGVRDLVIDGTGAGAASSGIHLGDGMGYVLDHLMVRNFTGTGSIGLYLDNNIWWTEKLRATQIMLSNCATGIVVDVTGTGTSSFEYNHLEAHCYANSGQACYVIQGGAQWNGPGGLKLSANMKNGSGPFLTITGGSKIYDSPLFCRMETGGGSITTPPQTILFGTTGGTDLIQQCTGYLLFTGTVAASNATAGNLDTFRGRIYGDTSLLATQSAQSISTPGFPASTVSVTNTTPMGVMVYLNPSGASITGFTIQGGGIGYGTFTTPISFYLPAGASVTPTYTGGPPTWQWRRVPQQ